MLNVTHIAKWEPCKEPTQRMMILSVQEIGAREVTLYLGLDTHDIYSRAIYGDEYSYSEHWMIAMLTEV